MSAPGKNKFSNQSSSLDAPLHPTPECVFDHIPSLPNAPCIPARVSLEQLLEKLRAIKATAQTKSCPAPNYLTLDVLRQGLPLLQNRERITLAGVALGGLLAFGTGMGLVGAVWFIASLCSMVQLEPYLELRKSLQPLSKDIGYTKARALAKEFPACEAYRREVFLQGREFLELDLQLMERIAA